MNTFSDLRARAAAVQRWVKRFGSTVVDTIDRVCDGNTRRPWVNHVVRQLPTHATKVAAGTREIVNRYFRAGLDQILASPMVRDLRQLSASAFTLMTDKASTWPGHFCFANRFVDMLRNPRIRVLKNVTGSFIRFSQKHPAITLAAAITPFAFALLTSCVPRENADVARTAHRSTQVQSSETPIPVPASQSARESAKAAPTQPNNQPHVLICRARDQLEKEIDDFVGSLERSLQTQDMAEVHTLRRVYGTSAFLRELEDSVNRQRKQQLLSDTQRSELNRLSDRWSELEHLMATLALVQETSK